MYETRPHDYYVEQQRIKLSRELERELAAEREKVRVLREALDEAQSCGGLTGSIFMQARAALAATEAKP